MDINSNYFSFPPFLSVAWSQVTAISLNATGQLIFHLHNQEAITLPILSKEETDQVFRAHAEYLEKEVLKDRPIRSEQHAAIRFGFSTSDNLTQELQHNPSQSQSPDLPQDALNKLTQVTRLLLGDEIQGFPKPVANCNCFHCQVARSVHNLKKEENHTLEEEIPDEELQFQQWEIVQTGDKLFKVINKLDREESYSVFLGNPVGCTCGKPGCEHILVVLKS